MNRTCFHLFVSSLISFFSVVYFSEYRSFTSLFRFIPRYFNRKLICKQFKTYFYQPNQLDKNWIFSIENYKIIVIWRNDQRACNQIYRERVWRYTIQEINKPFFSECCDDCDITILKISNGYDFFFHLGWVSIHIFCLICNLLFHLFLKKGSKNYLSFRLLKTFMWSHMRVWAVNFRSWDFIWSEKEKQRICQLILCILINMRENTNLVLY